jgi:protocatechuate 3,4-dioxygenase alpha subunit
VTDVSQSPTPSQTIGPFFHVAVPSGAPAVLTSPDDAGIALEGWVYDGDGDPVTDALVEVLDGAGRFGRCPTDETGRYAFVVTASPYLSVRVFARGLLGGLDTRCYLPLDGGEVARDAVLAALDPERAATLLAVAGDGGLRFDIHLQGEAETTFFAL